MSKPELRSRLEELEKEISELKPSYKVVKRKSLRYANFVMSLGMVNLLGQFSIIAAGTYMYACWDVMEPIAYVMLLGNIILGYSMYVYSGTNFELKDIWSDLQERKKNQLFQKLGLDPNKLDILKEDARKIRKELYSLP